MAVATETSLKNGMGSPSECACKAAAAAVTELSSLARGPRWGGVCGVNLLFSVFERLSCAVLFSTRAVWLLLEMMFSLILSCSYPAAEQSLFSQAATTQDKLFVWRRFRKPWWFVFPRYQVGNSSDRTDSCFSETELCIFTGWSLG